MKNRQFAIPALLLSAMLAGGCALVERGEPRAAIHRIESRPAANAVTTAHPLATRAALAMLERGGSPVDAAIAAQMVLGAVEPQSSGIGGGSLLMIWDAASGTLTSFDGLAMAPAGVTAGLTVDTDGTLLPRTRAQRGGRSVGVPGTLPALKAAHDRFGRLPWPALFAPAIRIAEEGFPLAPYMHGMLTADNAARLHPDLVPLYFGADGKVLPVGTVIRNPAYAQTLRRIADKGPQGLLDDGGAARIVAAAQRGFRPSLMTEQDLRAARAVERAPVCAPFLGYRVCTMAPPSHGGVVVLQILQMLEALGVKRYDFDDPAFVHQYLEAARLAQADRRRYVGDPGFVDVPVDALLSGDYLRQRAQLIDMTRANPKPAPGHPAAPVATTDSDTGDQGPATSQLAIADARGNVLSMTTTINLNFGSRLMVDGYVLNNALNLFSPAPQPGRRIANQMEAHKRPSTAMAPSIVFDPAGRVVAAGGSAGGPYIPGYIATSLIEMLANGRTPAQALARGHVSGFAPMNRVRVEQGTAAEKLLPALAEKGHEVEVRSLLSGQGFLLRREAGWLGASDPRRDGVAEGW
ncbi:MAG: gamma-glutamyltransferase family protein [Burkholderiales bacterium]|nr:gamma-glutamyltransferase family protein [Burkholderiales bacterium]